MVVSKTVQFASTGKAGKYRVHILDIAKSTGWTWKQESTFSDKFTKGQEAILVAWGLDQMKGFTHLMGDKLKGKVDAGHESKLQKLSTALGKPMTNTQKWSGLPLADLQSRAEKTFKVMGEPAKAAPAKAAPAKAAPAKAAPAKAAPAKAVSNEERQATRDAAHMAELA